MRGSIAIAFILSACADDSLKIVCGAECLPKGACRPGVITCDEAGNETGCEGWLPPSAEVCDGIDNDCDGPIDELLVPPTELCLNLGECEFARTKCVAGAWQCIYAPTVELPNETRCDGLDNDCDGRVDDIPVGNFCYSGPIGTEQGECRAGWLRCESGEWECVGERLPNVETCNHLDDDCDGVTDEGFNVPPVDIFVGMDISGSMPPYSDAAIAAIDIATSAVSIPDHQWGLLLYGTAAQPHWREEIPLGPFEPVMTRLRSLTYPGSYEPTMDAIAETCRSLAWRYQIRSVIIAFADEPAQCYSPTWCSSMAVASACAGIEVHVWTESGAAATYASFATVHQLNPYPELMAETLASIIGNACGE